MASSTACATGRRGMTTPSTTRMAGRVVAGVPAARRAAAGATQAASAATPAISLELNPVISCILGIARAGSKRPKTVRGHVPPFASVALLDRRLRAVEGDTKRWLGVPVDG